MNLFSESSVFAYNGAGVKVFLYILLLQIHNMSLPCKKVFLGHICRVEASRAQLFKTNDVVS